MPAGSMLGVAAAYEQVLHDRPQNPLPVLRGPWYSAPGTIQDDAGRPLVTASSYAFAAQVPSLQNANASSPSGVGLACHLGAAADFNSH